MMCQVAARQGLAPHLSDPDDRFWRPRLAIHLYEQTRRNSLEILDGMLLRAVGSLGRDNLTAESESAIRQECFGLLKQKLKLHQPWVKIDTAQASRDTEIATLRDIWVDFYGDPSSPETKARIDSCAKWLQTNSR